MPVSKQMVRIIKRQRNAMGLWVNHFFDTWCDTCPLPWYASAKPLSYTEPMCPADPSYSGNEHCNMTLLLYVTWMNIEMIISHMIVPSSEALQKTFGWLGDVASRFTRPAWQPNTCSTSCEVTSWTRILQSAAELATILSPDCGRNYTTFPPSYEYTIFYYWFYFGM